MSSIGEEIRREPRARSAIHSRTSSSASSTNRGARTPRRSAPSVMRRQARVGATVGAVGVARAGSDGVTPVGSVGVAPVVFVGVAPVGSVVAALVGSVGVARWLHRRRADRLKVAAPVGSAGRSAGRFRGRSPIGSGGRRADRFRWSPLRSAPSVAAPIGSGGGRVGRLRARREAQRRGLSVDSVRATPSAAGGARPLPTAVPRRFGARLSSCLHKKVWLPTWGLDRRRRGCVGVAHVGLDGRLRWVAAPIGFVVTRPGESRETITPRRGPTPGAGRRRDVADRGGAAYCLYPGPRSTRPGLSAVIFPSLTTASAGSRSRSSGRAGA